MSAGFQLKRGGEAVERGGDRRITRQSERGGEREREREREREIPSYTNPISHGGSGLNWLHLFHWGPKIYCLCPVWTERWLESRAEAWQTLPLVSCFKASTSNRGIERGGDLFNGFTGKGSLLNEKPSPLVLRMDAWLEQLLMPIGHAVCPQPWHALRRYG